MIRFDLLERSLKTASVGKIRKSFAAAKWNPTEKQIELMKLAKEAQDAERKRLGDWFSSSDDFMVDDEYLDFEDPRIAQPENVSEFKKLVKKPGNYEVKMNDDLVHEIAVYDCECYVDYGVKDQKKRDIGCRRIEFIGGEPTVYPQFEELLEYAVALGHGVEIFSNLQALNDQIIGVAKDNDITVHFSIYGSSAAIHDSVTRMKGSFEILMHRLDRLLESNVRVVPAITIMRQNQEDIDCIIALLVAKGIPQERISIDAVRSTSCRATAGLEITDSQKNLALRRKPNFRAEKNFFQKARCANTCLFGKISIHSDGLVSPCEFARDIVYGNVKDQTIEQIMNSEELTKFWYFDFTKIESCNGCEYRFACKDCRMLRDKSEICKKNPRCLYDPQSGVWMEFENCGAG